jgi:hypothetical protein
MLSVVSEGASEGMLFSAICAPCVFTQLEPTTEVRLFDHLVLTGEHWLGWSFGQPGSPQSFFQSREVFGTQIRALHVFESGDT